MHGESTICVETINGKVLYSKRIDYPENADIRMEYYVFDSDDSDFCTYDEFELDRAEDGLLMFRFRDDTDFNKIILSDHYKSIFGWNYITCSKVNVNFSICEHCLDVKEDAYNHFCGWSS
jgi:hypothetical protein